MGVHVVNCLGRDVEEVPSMDAFQKSDPSSAVYARDEESGITWAPVIIENTFYGEWKKATVEQAAFVQGVVACYRFMK